MTRLTPLDDFLRDFSAWLDTAWYVWAGLGLVLAATVAVVWISKARARARARLPQYRRTSS